MKELESKDPKDIALAIARSAKTNNKRKRVVVITQGPDPVLVSYFDIFSGDYVIKEYPV